MKYGIWWETKSRSGWCGAAELSGWKELDCGNEDLFETSDINLAYKYHSYFIKRPGYSGTFKFEVKERT